MFQSKLKQYCSLVELASRHHLVHEYMLHSNFIPKSTCPSSFPMWSTTPHLTFSTRATTSHPLPRRLKSTRPTNDVAKYLVAITIGMVGLTYAAVPLYRMFCQATGFGGTVKEGAGVEEKLRARAENPDKQVEAAAATRDLLVTFNSDVADNLSWKFYPTQKSLKIHPGQSTLAFYTAHNTGDKAVTGVSTYNVTPQQVGQYFNKVQCFCFEEQKLRPNEKVDMPVFFYIDPEFATDPKMKGINTVTLSYTFYKVSEDNDESVEEAV